MCISAPKESAKGASHSLRIAFRIVLAYWHESQVKGGRSLMLRSTVMTPPMVGSTWLRVHSTLESDCLPALSQGAALLCLVVDLLIIIFTVATHIRCLVIGVVLVRLIDRLTFSLSYMRPWELFSNRLSGLLTWYFVSHDRLPLVRIHCVAITAHIC